MNHSSITIKIVLSFLFSLALASFSPTANADLFDPSPLSFQSYSHLHLPPQLDKMDIAAQLQLIIDQLYGEAFVDIGEMSDFMHGHILFNPGCSASDRTDSCRKPLAILYHTQEFPNIRANQTYLYKGKPIDPFNRNWLVWMAERAGYQPATLTPAAKLLPKDTFHFPPTTVSSDMLDKKIFGEGADVRSVTFFFYRFRCDDLKPHPVPEARLRESNVLQLRLEGKPLCLALVNEPCNSSKESTPDCTGDFSLTAE